ncbi:hypothetical protein [Actinomyces urogenitalis]|uniref:hypothetical protein n=1 Tax=Actinomyces urogenitalis TaxID=103621 RepID=UPI0029039FB1|nr:hypothetical protein [Actinomyces urogenitalis]MDU0864448.1 hypothetical protein [Actinomyces urogenitalis]MDU0874994.1 hypothetical protein [Actinomyces urogenitalis]MDU1565335.1 hypothetical protein [Actinomyces urogenitalis]MDU1640578.1 hypothetical protein [Actinomyces urogenitalis]MDU6777752.1 hypothetical protein [Actinomyces urogenitalis]
MSTLEMVRRIVALKVASDRIRTMEKAAKAEAVEALGPGGRMHAVTPGGEDFGTVSVSMPKRGVPAPVVVDPAALASWLAEEDPSAVRMVPADWWVQALPSWVEAHDGEVPPGVEIVEPRERAPYVSVRLSEEQRAVVDRLSMVETAGLIEAGEDR